MNIEIFGTLGPRDCNVPVLTEMFENGMTGVRLNLSHTNLSDCEDWLAALQTAAAKACVSPELLIDLRGPELRIGTLEQPAHLETEDKIVLYPETAQAGSLHTADSSCLSDDRNDHLIRTPDLSGCRIRTPDLFGCRISIPCPAIIFPYLLPGQKVLLNDGTIEAEVLSTDRTIGVETLSTDGTIKAEVLSNGGTVKSQACLNDEHAESQACLNTAAAAHCVCRILRGGTISSRKSIALPGTDIYPPTLTGEDLLNLDNADKYHVTGVMLPFVRNKDDLLTLRRELDQRNLRKIRIFAKIENLDGVRMLPELLPHCDHVVIARGDLGNATTLQKLIAVQKQIAALCRKENKPFMVVTQMLASMEHSAVPTRAEVSDIFNAVLDGAASLMVTGETAVGDYPVETIRYLYETAQEAENFSQEFPI